MNELAKLKESQTFLRRVLASVLLQRHGGQTTVDLKNGWLSTDSRFEPVIVTYTNDDGRNLVVSVKNTTEPLKREEAG